MRKGKIAVLVALALAITLGGCGGNSDAEDLPSSSTVESQTSSEAAKPASKPTSSTAEASSQREESSEAASEPAESEESTETTPEPAKQSAESAPASSAASAPVTSSAPVSSQAPTHTHSYTSAITQQAACEANGVLTYTCSCGDSYTEAIPASGHAYDGGTVTKAATCMEEGVKTFTCAKCGAVYTEAMPVNSDHTWATRHVDAYGYYEKGETHEVLIKKCAGCGYQVNSDMPNANELWERHLIDCGSSYSYWTEQVPNGEPKWIEVVPEHDETYCTACGMIQ